jgi:hypothetical protein
MTEQNSVLVMAKPDLSWVVEFLKYFLLLTQTSELRLGLANSGNELKNWAMIPNCHLLQMHLLLQDFGKQVDRRKVVRVQGEGLLL